MRRLALLLAFLVPGASVFAQETGKATPEQLAQGKTLYLTVCIACHQPTGAGLPPVFPSIVKSDYVNSSPKRLVAMVLKGINPPFTYKGVTYAVPMIAQEALLDDAKIAAILTYVRASFENSAPPVTAEFVAGVRKELAARKLPWTQAELDNWKDDAVAAPALTAPEPATAEQTK